MKIAIIGCRGIPAKYGGFETFAQGLTENLVKNGYDITVSCEYEPSQSRKDNYKGAKLEYFPIKPPKNYFLRKVYENLSDIYFLIKLSRKHQLIYFLGIEVGMFLFIPKILSRRSHVLVNIDGVMWQRSKFNLLERWLLKINHDMATVFADEIIVDAKEMKSYVDKKYLDKTSYLSYGINVPKRITWNGETLELLKDYTPINISPGNYYLVVSRLEPENNIHTIVDAFIQAEIDIPLVVVGDFTSEAYKEEIESITKDCSQHGVIFLGSIYNQNLLNMLRQNCCAYIHGHSVGGTNPSLLEAAISRNIIMAHDNPFNREVCGASAVYFKNEIDLSRKMKSIYKHQQSYLKLKDDAYYRVKNNYLWDRITEGYISLFQKIIPEDEEFITYTEIDYDQKDEA
jgi:rhamnosyltransferase